MGLYDPIEYEDEVLGHGVTTQAETLARHADVLRNADIPLYGPGALCPRCGHWGVMFFGDPDAVHLCMTCQIIAAMGQTYEVTPGVPWSDGDL